MQRFLTHLIQLVYIALVMVILCLKCLLLIYCDFFCFGQLCPPFYKYFFVLYLSVLNDYQMLSEKVLAWDTKQLFARIVSSMLQQ